MAKGDHVDPHVAAGPERKEVDVEADAEGDEAGEHGRVGTGVHGPVVPQDCETRYGYTTSGVEVLGGCKRGKAFDGAVGGRVIQD